MAHYGIPSELYDQIRRELHEQRKYEGMIDRVVHFPDGGIVVMKVCELDSDDWANYMTMRLTAVIGDNWECTKRAEP